MKFWIFLLLAFLGLPANAQIDFDVPLQSCRLNTGLLKSNEIKSLIVFAEFGYDGNDGIEDGSVSGKVREYQFDSTGNTVYKITCDGHGNYPFIEYGRGSEIEFSNYNSQNLCTLFSEEDYLGISYYITEYNSDGNLILSEWSHEGRNLSGHNEWEFTWKEGEMIKAREILPSGREAKQRSVFDDEGRVVEYISDDFRTTNSFSINGDTLVQVQTNYKSDTLASINTYSSLKMFENQYVYYSRQNYKKELELEMKVVYDEDGNTTNYYLTDFTPEYDEMGNADFRKSTNIEVVNTYDSRGLLIKQLFYRLESQEVRTLVKIYRYVYDTDSLAFKFEPSELRAKEVEMNESYGRDY